MNIESVSTEKLESDNQTLAANENNAKYDPQQVLQPCFEFLFS